MSATLRHIAAIRSRLLSDPNLVALLGADSLGNPSIHLGHIFDVIEPVYPLITLMQMNSTSDVGFSVPGGTIYGGTNVLNPCVVLIESYVRPSNTNTGTIDQVSLIDDYVFALLHKREQLTSGPGADFHEIRRTWNNTGMWDNSVNCWRTASQYLVRVFLT